MLKKIPLNKVRLGMYIQEMQGSWLNNPFWRKSFKLDDAQDLKKLLASGLNMVVIDTARGLDVEAIAEPSATTSSLEQAPVAETRSLTSPPRQENRRISAADERAQAQKILKSAKSAVSAMFKEVRMGKAIDAQDAMPVVEEITASIVRNEGALISLVRLKSKDDYTYMHSVAVCALMVSLARELELSETATKQAGLAGLLHDVGKMLIPYELLSKPDKLTDTEFDVVKLHPSRGHEILSRSQTLGDVAMDVCLHHHEKIDGSGYPDKLDGSQISLFAKMGAVCDVYDAVTSNRPYKEGWEPGVSLQRMAQWTGSHFDDAIFKAFVKSVGIYPIGSMVVLKSGRLAVVVDQNLQSLLTPVVKVFFSTVSRQKIKPEYIDLSKPDACDAILKHEDPAVWGISDLRQIWTH